MKGNLKVLSWAAAGLIAAALIGCAGQVSAATQAVSPVPESTDQATIAPADGGGANPATTPEFNGPMFTAVPPATDVAPSGGAPGGGAADGEVNTTRVTMDDNGKTVTLKVGDEILLVLEGNVDQPERLWSVDISDQSVLSRVMGIMVIQGAQGLFKAHQPGTTMLSATGDLPCRSATPPCMAPSLAFQVTVVVQG